MLKAPPTFSKSRELNEWDLDRLTTEFNSFRSELFIRGFIVNNYALYLQSNGTVALDGFEHFGFKMLRPDGTWYSQEPNN